MTRLTPCLLVSVCLLAAAPASAVPVDLVDGAGSLYWETTISVASPTENTNVDHPNFPANRHPHEGWYLYVVELDQLHEFTAFTKTVDGASQDSLSATYTLFTGDSFFLSLNYGITATGPNGLPDLAWSGSLGRTNNPASPFPVLNVRLFNVFDYDVGDDGNSDTANLASVSPTVFELAGSGGVTGFRGANSTSHYTAGTLAATLAQIQGVHQLDDSVAGGAYDVAGAFEWDYLMCSAANIVPECSVGGSGVVTAPLSGLGGFGGFDDPPPDPVPEPSTFALLLAGLVPVLWRAKA